MTHPETGRELIWFAPNYGVNVHAALLDEAPERILALLTMAFNYCQNEYLKDACQGGRGPLLKRFCYGCRVSLEDFLDALEEIRIEEETKATKRGLTRQRRAEFQRGRADLMLRLIDSGVLYICKAEGCGISEALTLDHIEPLSRGGSDDLENLQFLCRSHNSQKGARVAAA